MGSCARGYVGGTAWGRCCNFDDDESETLPATGSLSWRNAGDLCANANATVGASLWCTARRHADVRATDSHQDPATTHRVIHRYQLTVHDLPLRKMQRMPIHHASRSPNSHFRSNFKAVSFKRLPQQVPLNISWLVILDLDRRTKMKTMKRITFACQQVSRPDRRGAVLVLAAAMLLVVFGIAAFTVDFGILNVTKGQIQNAADSAAQPLRGI